MMDISIQNTICVVEIKHFSMNIHCFASECCVGVIVLGEVSPQHLPHRLAHTHTHTQWSALLWYIMSKHGGFLVCVSIVGLSSSRVSMDSCPVWKDLQSQTRGPKNPCLVQKRGMSPTRIKTAFLCHPTEATKWWLHGVNWNASSMTWLLALL